MGGKGYKTACGAGRVGQSFRMLAHVCLVLDLEGFEVQGQFLVRELGWCDWTGQHWRTTHYYPTQPYPEAWKDRRLVRFVRRHIHGLPYTPNYREQARPAAALEQDVRELVHTFQRPNKTVVAYKGGHYEKELLQRWGIPYFNLEQARCPKFDTIRYPPRLCQFASPAPLVGLYLLTPIKKTHRAKNEPSRCGLFLSIFLFFIYLFIF